MYPFSGKNAGIVLYVTNEFWLPIKPNKVGNGCTFNLDCIVDAAAEALAVEPLTDGIDYLEIIAQLYLEYIDIIPQIIRRYHLSMFDRDANCNELVQKAAYKIFGCETRRIYDPFTVSSWRTDSDEKASVSIFELGCPYALKDVNRRSVIIFIL